MVHEVAVEAFHGVVTAVGAVACDSRAIRAILVIQTVANIDHTTQVTRAPSDFVYIG